MQMSIWFAILHAATAADLTWSDISDSYPYEAAEEKVVAHPDEAPKEEANLHAATAADLTRSDIADSDPYEAAEEEVVAHPDEAPKEEANLHAATAADLTWSDIADSDDPDYEAAEEEVVAHPDEAAKEEAKLAAAQQAASQATPEMAEVAEHKAADIAGERCSHDFTSCTDTKCCSNPGFGCYKRVGKLYAQCKRKVSKCVDSAEWLCPESWADCSDSFGDCRASHCCSRSVDKCMRRSHMYYAQCRPELPEKGFSQCVDWRTGTATTESWLCPGWEECAAPHEECTMSRCCTDAVRRRAHAML
jgi:hypothetical protein